MSSDFHGSNRRFLNLIQISRTKIKAHLFADLLGAVKDKLMTTQQKTF